MKKGLSGAEDYLWTKDQNQTPKLEETEIRSTCRRNYLDHRPKEEREPVKVYGKGLRCRELKHPNEIKSWMYNNKLPVVAGIFGTLRLGII
jgi:hypothetical protein